MRMVVRGSVGVGVRLDHGVGRHQHDAAVADAALGDHVLGEMLHLRRSCRAGSSPPCSCRGRDGRAWRRATIRGGRGRCRRAAWRAAGHCGRRRRPGLRRNRPCLSSVSRRLPDAGASEVADRLRAVLVAAGLDDAVELGHQFVVNGDGHALHGNRIRAPVFGSGVVLVVNRSSRPMAGSAKKQTRPDGKSGRAALTDAGVDGGARADRNQQS